MVVSAETLRVDLVDVLGAGGTRGEPTAGRDHLDAADRRIVARCAVDDALDFLSAELRDAQLRRRELRQPPLLLGGGRRLDAVGRRLAELTRELAVDLAGIAAH